jgi:hypothetical protein
MSKEADMCVDRFRLLAIALLVAWLTPLPGRAVAGGAPLVVFDVPFSAECRDVTPKNRAETYQRKIVEAVFRISPQVYSGQDTDVKRLRYEISTEQQMPVVSFLPNAEVTTDVADGTIAIQANERHGNLSFQYMITPAAGNGQLRGDLESSRAQYSLLAPKQLLLAAGTIDRGCGVFYDLRASTQDTLQRQREFACLFEVPKNWRADYVTIRCKARGLKRGFAGIATEADCGAGLLCVGLYMLDDEQARAYAEQLAKTQQQFLRSLGSNARQSKDKSGENSLSDMAQMFASRATRSGGSTMKMGEVVAARIEEKSELAADLTSAPSDAAKDFEAVKRQIRKMNGREP